MCAHTELDCGKIKGEMSWTAVVRCPSCAQNLRVPKDRGALDVTCPKCWHEFRHRPAVRMNTKSPSAPPEAEKKRDRAKTLRYAGAGLVAILILLEIGHEVRRVADSVASVPQTPVTRVASRTPPAVEKPTEYVLPRIESPPNDVEYRPIAVTSRIEMPREPLVPTIKPVKFKKPASDPDEWTVERPKAIVVPPEMPDVPAVDPLATRPTSGTVIVEGSRPSALGTFEATNGSDKDAVVFLVPVGETEAAIAFYVRSGDTHKIRGVPDGAYEIYFRSGRDWHESAQSFAREELLNKFDRSSIYETREEPNQTVFKEIRITLEPRIDGNATIHGVSPSTFPKAKKIER